MTRNFPNRSSHMYLPAFGLCLLSLLAFAPGITAPFVTTGEAREALVAQSMIVEHDLLKSIRYDQDLATKPPLLHWVMVASAAVSGGLNETAARLPSVIAAALAMTAWMLFLLPRLGFGRALLCLAVLATSIEWYRHAALARVDMLLASCITGALIALFLWTEGQQFKFLLAAAVLMALGALTKGPIGIALPLLICLTALIYWRTAGFGKVFPLFAAGFIACLPLCCWYLAQYQASEGSIMQIILAENIERLFGKMSSGRDPHSHGIFYLFGVFFSGLLPWSLLALFALPAAIKSRTNILAKGESRRLIQWCCIAVAVCLVVFMFPESKRGAYLLPIYPAAATVIAVLLDDFSKSHAQACQKLALAAAALFCLLWVGVLVLRIGLLDPRSFASSPKQLAETSFYFELFQLAPSKTPVRTWLIQLLPFAAVPLLLVSIKKSPASVFLRLTAVLLLLLAFLKLNFIVPAAELLSPKPFIAAQLEKHKPAEIGLSRIRMYAEIFYARQLYPELIIKDYDKAAGGGPKHILLWQEDESLLAGPAQIYKSASNAEKPGRHLAFAVLK